MALPFVKKHWGKIYFAMWCAGSTLSLHLKGIPSGHYDIFTAAPKLLWAGQNPYGIVYEYGAFVYSPLAALFYFPFAVLPYGLGLFLLTALSLFVFGLGLWLLLKKVPLTPFWGEVFFFVLSSEIIGSILNVRLEILITGMLMLASYYLLENRRLGLAWALLALICNFKFQALAPTGLLLAYFVVIKRSWRECLYFVGFSVAYILGPAIFWGWELNSQSHVSWIKYVGSAIDISFYTFQHIYAFIKNTLGFEIPYKLTQYLSLGAGGALLVWTLLEAKVENSDALNILRPVALGSAFVCAFSPASQSAAYIYYTPLLLLYFLWQGKSRRLWLSGLLFAWFFVSIAYSDLVGPTGRDLFFRLAVKPLGIMIMLGYIFYFDLKNQFLARGEPPTGSPLRAKR